MSCSAPSVEHYTPAPIVEAARIVLGGIDLDPASCMLANETVRAAAFYGEGGVAPDGLIEPWCGRVFLNPPGGKQGGRSSAACWWKALARAWQAGEVDAAIFVGFSLEILRSAQGLGGLQPLDFPLCVPSKRIAFGTPTGPSNAPINANVIVFLPPVFRPNEWIGEDVDRFAATFDAFGRCRI